MTEEKKARPFGLADKVGYAFGDFGNDFTFMLSVMFLMKFYTDVVGVSAAIVGIMMMVARFVDAFTDVAMGRSLTVRRRQRTASSSSGCAASWARLPWLPPSIFAPWVASFPMGGRIAWMLITYILWGSVCYTGVNIPYGSMASAITSDPKERQSLSTWRTLGATMAATAIGVILPMVVYYRDAEGHTTISSGRMFGAAVVCSIGAIVCYLLCLSLTTERVKIEKVGGKGGEKVNVIKTIFTSRSLLGIIVAALVFLLAQLSLSGMAAYIFPNYFNNAKGQSMVTLVGTVVTLVLSVFVSKLVSRFGKKEVGIIGSLLTTATLLVIYFLHTTNMTVYIVLYAVAYIGLALFNLIIWAMITDVIDDMELKNGVRQDGTVYSVYSFARKMGQAFSSGLTGGLLTIIGYTKETQFDESVVNGIYDVTAIAPAIGFAVLAVVLIFLYPLSRKKVEENAKALAAKRAS